MMKTPFFNGKALLFIALIVGTSFNLLAQENEKSTEDLNFLTGTWEVERIYNPTGDEPRILIGTLVCKTVMDSTFINCRYEMERPGKIRGLDEVYFNYNAIYDTYESLWLSSTWPIKVLMQGTIEDGEEAKVLATKAEFEIQNQVMEYVSGKLFFDPENTGSFMRETHIRTSEYEEGVWYHHMTEKVKKVVD